MNRLSTFLPPPAVPNGTSLASDPLAISSPAGRAAPTHNHPADASPLAGRVSLVHDYLLVMRGAERTFAAIADLYTDAPIFTLLHDEQGTNGRFAGRSITTSRLQHLGIDQSTFRWLLPLYPLAVERLKLPASDLVLSSSKRLRPWRSRSGWRIAHLLLPHAVSLCVG